MTNLTYRDSDTHRLLSSGLKVGLLLLLCWTTVTGFTWLPAPTTGFLHPQLARMMVFHVPCSLVGTVASVVATVYAVMYLRKPSTELDIKSRVSFSIALLMWVLTTITGAVFSKAQWGQYWSLGEIKQACILLLLLILAAYFALRASIDDPKKQASAGAVYAIYAMVAIPFLTYVLPNATGQSLHPKGTITTNDGMTFEYKWVLWLGFVGLTAVYVWMFRIQVAYELLLKRSQQLVQTETEWPPSITVREGSRSL